MTQIKPFTPETVTQEVAARIMSVLVWNHLSAPGYTESIEINDAGWIGRAPDGGTISPWDDSLSERGYVKESHGVILVSPRTGGHVCRLFSDGGALVRDKIIGWPGQVELVKLYVELGFYSLDRTVPAGAPIGSPERVAELLRDTLRNRDRYPGQAGISAGLSLLLARTGTNVEGVRAGEIVGPSLHVLANAISENDAMELAAMGWRESDGSIVRSV